MIRMQLRKVPASNKKVFLATFASIMLFPFVAHLALARTQSNTDSNASAVPPRVSLPLQVGFFNGATALYITPEVGVDPNAPAAIIAAAIRSPTDSTPISFQRTSGRSLTPQRSMTSSCSRILPKETS